MLRNIKSKAKVSERLEMDGSFPQTEQESIARYIWASQFTEGKTVVDAGCGVGHGKEYLKAEKYIGLDKIVRKGVKTVNLNTCVLPKADVLLAFEVIEHLEDPLKFIEKAKKYDTFIFSVPIEPQGTNPHHLWTFDENSLKDLLPGFEWLHQEIGRAHV